MSSTPHSRAAAVVVFIAVALVAAASYYHYAPGPLPQAATVIIKRGSGFRAAVDTLAENGVVRYPSLFKAMAVITGSARKFKAGEYHFPEASSPRMVMQMLIEGRVVPHRLTVPEGLTVSRVAMLLADEQALTGDMPPDIEEGSLLPETYHFVYGDTREDLIARMQRDMAVLVSGLWEQRREGLPFTTPMQAVTLASIVEKETSIDEERGRIASVFVNRLRLGMRLQSDPTVAYGIELDKGPLEAPLTRKDLEYDSPYNTYKVAGLPPGPIANPGRASIKAVLNPPDTKDLYFVATGDGGHYFAKTLAEHNANVREYRKRLKQKQN